MIKVKNTFIYEFLNVTNEMQLLKTLLLSLLYMFRALLDYHQELTKKNTFIVTGEGI